MYATSSDEHVVKQEVLLIRPNWTAILNRTVVGMGNSLPHRIFNITVIVTVSLKSAICLVLFAVIWRRLRKMHALPGISSRSTNLQRQLTMAIFIQVCRLYSLKFLDSLIADQGARSPTHNVYRTITGHTHNPCCTICRPAHHLCCTIHEPTHDVCYTICELIHYVCGLLLHKVCALIVSVWRAECSCVAANRNSFQFFNSHSPL